MEVTNSLVQKAEHYQPNSSKLARIKDHPLVFLVGISGAGKNAILHRLLEEHPKEYHFIVSHTTRAPRKNDGVLEQDGVAYHFVDTGEFEHMVDEGDFFEVNVYANKAYGTSIQEVAAAQNEGNVAISDVDINGADAYDKLDLNVRSIFVLPPSYEEWSARLAGRGELAPEELKLRLQTAVDELQHALDVDYFYIVINDDLEKTTQLVHNIAQGAEVDRHYPKAMEIAQKLLDRIRAKLAELEA